VIPFPIDLKAGLPISDQIVYAATRAIVSGAMRAGDAFPSVRALSKELRINPNTAHKAVAELIQAGLLATYPGIGTVVTTPPNSTLGERTQLLETQIEALVVDARRLGIAREELVQAMERQFERLTPDPGGKKTR
jgi:GntR family transcriptional regulator